MKQIINTIFLIICWQLLASGSVYAQTYDEGRAAYISGNYSTALDILTPLAESGDAEAQKMLGIMYDYGQGVEANPQTALQWYIKSAEQGQTAVQYQVGAKYFKGESIPQDYNEAARWWQLAADGGQVDAQFNLGLMYFRGLGISQDDVMAASMFQQAAEQDHANAQYSLGVMFAFGRGVDQDYEIAREWFLQAADNGVSQAQYNLGIFYENGNGVERDIEQARTWYQMAGLKRERWLRDQNPDQYTIQIGSVLNEDDLVNFLKRHNIENESAYIQMLINGVTRYNAFYGIFTTYQEAQSAVGQLPNEIQRSSPWIRNIGILQGLLN